MARTAAGAALTAQHGQLQRRLSAGMLAQLLRLWPAVDTQAPETFDLFSAAAVQLVLAGRRTSAGLAAAYLAGFGIAEGITSAVRPAPVPELPGERVDGLLRGAAVTGILNARSAGFGVAAEARQGFVKLAGQATSLVLSGGRDTVIETVVADPVIRGYQRVTSGEACAFCAMLASRGPVYATAFDVHDHCACTVEPLYEGSRMPARSVAYRSLWDRATAGLSGSDAFRAFRGALEAPADAEAAA